MKTLVIQAESNKIKALSQMLKAFGVTFEIKNEEEEYDPEFVKMVLDSSKEKNGVLLTQEYKNELFQGL